MDRFVVRQNIDHFIELLRVEVVPETRHSRNSLLIEEENQLARDLEHRQVAESRAAKLREQYNRMARIRDGLQDGSDQREAADRMLVTFQVTLTLADGACERLRQQANHAPL